jgi:ATP-dependent helicase STH1/SNF2
MDNRLYNSLEEFTNDFNLMFNNAMTYNVEGSFVYNDAVELRNSFNAALDEARRDQTNLL